MKKAIFVLAVLMLISTSVTAQYILFTNTTRIFDLDTGSVMRFYKVPLPQTGYKNFYVQRGGIYIDQYTMDMRIGNVLRYIYSANGFSDSAHHRRFHNEWSFQYGYNLGYVLDLAFSTQDTNLFLYAYQGANWEPADGTGISYNNGLTVNGILPTSLLNNCGGMAIDPVNDSIMYVGYSAQMMIGNVHKSTNRGANWFCVDTLPESIYGSKLFVNNFSRNTIFISKGTNLYRSTTGGTDFQIIKTGVSNVRMRFDAIDNTVYMSSTTTDGFLKSTNNGTSWATLLSKAVSDFEFDPLNGSIVYAGCTDGLYKSINKGSTWTIYNNSFMPDVNVKGIVKNPNTGDTLFVSTNKAVYKVFGPSVVDTSMTNYFPIAVGNIYVYGYYTLMPPALNKYKIRITKDTVAAGKRFFYTSQIFPGFNANENWIRMNGNTGVISSLSGTSCNYMINEKYVDSLNSRKGDTLNKCTAYSQSLCSDTSANNIFGIPSKQKVFRQDGIVLNYRTYSKYFGLTSSRFIEGDDVTHILMGCRINGITYGDTLLTGIEHLSGEIPSSYSLGQNYPNPFNPMCNVQFTMCNAGKVKIVVYDVQGREVQTLVDERLNAGTYEMKFDGSMLTSGVYFYRMVTEGFSETRKMLLIK